VGGYLHELKRGFLIAAIASIVVAALMAVFALVSGKLSETDRRILFTVLLLAGTCAISLAASSVSRKTPLLAGIDIVLAGAAFLFALVPIWSDGGGDFRRQLPTSLYVGASALAYGLLLLSRHRPSDGQSVVIAEAIALVSLVCLTAMILYAIAHQRTGSSWAKAMGATAVIMVAATLIIGLLRRLSPMARSEPEPRTPSDLAGRTIVRVEHHGSRTIIVLDDGRQLPLAPE
jgi:hypothetical protein